MDRVMKYKGYVGSIEVSVEDNCLYGKIQHISGLIMYEGSSPDELKAMFHEAVDEYVEDCKADGVDPCKPFSGSFNVRIDPEVHKKASVAALSAGIKLNQFVAKAIEEKLNDQKITVENHKHEHHHTYSVEASVEPSVLRFVAQGAERVQPVKPSLTLVN